MPTSSRVLGNIGEPLERSQENEDDLIEDGDAEYFPAAGSSLDAHDGLVAFKTHSNDSEELDLDMQQLPEVGVV